MFASSVPQCAKKRYPVRASGVSSDREDYIEPESAQLPQEYLLDQDFLQTGLDRIQDPICVQNPLLDLLLHQQQMRDRDALQQVSLLTPPWWV